MLSKITIVNNSRSGHEDVPKTHQEELCRSKTGEGSILYRTELKG